MHDQAESLRLKMLHQSGHVARSIAIVSGKGGVGKSNFSTNFAWALQKLGKKVIVVDMDIGMGNVHILLGLTPNNSLKDYLIGQQSLDNVIQRDTDCIDFIAGGSGLDEVVHWSETMFDRLLSAFEELQQQYDFILFDMGAGATERTIELILSVDEVIVISTTEPTSITDAYSMMKFICLKDPDKQFNIVANRVLNDGDGFEAASRLQYAMQKFLKKETILLGYLPEDEAVQKAVLEQIPFIVRFPTARVSKKMMAIAQKFVEVPRSTHKHASSGFLERLKSIFKKGRG